MYRMQHHKKEIRIYVRNKARYNPETKERDFLFVDINNFAGTTIGDIKEVRIETHDLQPEVGLKNWVMFVNKSTCIYTATNNDRS